MKKLILIILLFVFLTVPLVQCACDQSIDGYAITNYVSDFSLDGVGEKCGQAITNSGAHTLCNASFYLKYAGVRSYNYAAKLYASSGTVGSNAVGTGAALATSTVYNGSRLTTDMQLVHFDFSSTPYDLIDGTDYVIVVEIVDRTSGSVVVGTDNSGSHAGNTAWDIGSGWSSHSSYDSIFYIYEEMVVETPTPTALTHTKSQTWVNHTWGAGAAPNVTDSYNASVNGVWHNATTVPYYLNSGLSGGAWSNITVFAWNSTYSELSSGSVSENVQTGTRIAWDDFNRADNNSLGPKWHEEADNWWILDNRLMFVNETSAAVINQDVALSQGDYTFEFTYIDMNATATTTRLMTHFYMQSHTDHTESMVIQFRESNNYILAYWGNGTYITDTGDVGLSMTNNTVYRFTVDGDNVSIFQNGTHLAYLEVWGDRWSGGTIGFSSDILANVTAIDDFSVMANGDAPSITSYGPTGNIYPEVYDSQTFNVMLDKTAGCEWYLNGSLMETDSEDTDHTYTNTSLEGGTWNVTAVVGDIFGEDSQTWIFEVGADSITFIVLQDTPLNTSMIAEFEVTRIGGNVTQWSHNQSVTFNGWVYNMRFAGGSLIVSHTAEHDNDILLFNRTPMLPAGTYYLNAIASTLTAQANQYYMFNNWTVWTSFSQIAANEENDVVYTWYNHVSGLYESYYVGRSYNANVQVPANCSVSCFFNAQTTISPVPRNIMRVPGGRWYNAFLLGAPSLTPTEIKASMDDDGLDCWEVYRWTGTAYATTGDVHPCEGIVVWCNETRDWSI